MPNCRRTGETQESNDILADQFCIFLCLFFCQCIKRLNFAGVKFSRPLFHQKCVRRWITISRDQNRYAANRLVSLPKDEVRLDLHSRAYTRAYGIFEKTSVRAEVCR